MSSSRHSRNGFLCRKGLEEAAQREAVRYGLDTMDMFGDLDSMSSVSGLRRDETLPIWDEELLDEQHRRFHSFSEEVA